MLAFSNIDFNDRKNRFRISLDPEKEDSHPFSEDMNQQYDIEDKQEDEELSINGFKHIFTRTIHNNIKHMTFSDGLNMFSVFIN